MSDSPSIYTWSRFVGRSLLSAYGPESTVAIQKLVFVITKRCHSRCVYCDIWKAKDQPGGLDGELDDSEIARIAQANSDLQWIDFTGGEPSDRQGFAELVESFDRACPHLALAHFPTNGLATVRIAAIAERLARTLKSRLVVTVSIDGPPELNDRLRGVPRDFQHALATFAAVRRHLGVENTYVGMTLHAHTGSCGRSTRKLVEETFAAVNAELAVRNEPPLGWGNLHLNIPHISQHYYDNQKATAAVSESFASPAHRAEVAEALRFAASQTKNSGSLALRLLERAYRHEALRYLSTGDTRVPCSALLSTAYLSAKGEVYPCTIWDKPLGNVRDHDYALAPIIHKARTNGLRADVAAGRCPRCWTPCEAYPALAASPLRAARALLG
jgi:MoaA/NifB/PqqE/SkfB family radical SAM enzyme